MKKSEKSKNQSVKVPKLILWIVKFLEKINSHWTVLFAAKLFTTPINHKIPKRELKMMEESVQEKLYVSSLNKEIMLYHYGSGEKKVLLVHGWSGRGTQLFKIAEELLKNGYSTLSFDAPAHGKSQGKTTIMIEFISCILEIEKKFGPFEYAIGHSLGGMSILNAIKQNLNIRKAVIIGSGNIIQDIVDDFVEKLCLSPKIAGMLSAHFEKKFGESMDAYSSYNAAKAVKIPILIIHDNDDQDVNVKAAHAIDDSLINSQLLITNTLGHRKILGDSLVIQSIIDFLK